MTNCQDGTLASVILIALYFCILQKGCHWEHSESVQIALKNNSPCLYQARIKCKEEVNYNSRSCGVCWALRIILDITGIKNEHINENGWDPTMCTISFLHPRGFMFFNTKSSALLILMCTFEIKGTNGICLIGGFHHWPPPPNQTYRYDLEHAWCCFLISHFCIYLVCTALYPCKPISVLMIVIP